MKNKVIDNLIIKPGLFKLLVRLTDVCLFLLYSNLIHKSSQMIQVDARLPNSTKIYVYTVRHISY